MLDRIEVRSYSKLVKLRKYAGFKTILLLFRYVVDEYVMLEGKWSEGNTETKEGLITLQNGKRYCSNEESCFGVMESFDAGYVFSIYFPILMVQRGGDSDDWLYHKKKYQSGNLL